MHDHAGSRDDAVENVGVGPIEGQRALVVDVAVIDGELVLPDPAGAPDFYGLQKAMAERQSALVVFAFDLLHSDGIDLCPLQLTQRKHMLADVVNRAKVGCLQLIATFPDGAKLLGAAERMRLEGVVSKRRTAPYRSGECRHWVKVKTAAWREANRER